MPVLRSSAKLAAREDAEPYKPHLTPRKSKFPKNTSKATRYIDSGLTDDNDTSTSGAAINRRAATKQRREMCTAEQTADLEDFYMLYGGTPTKEQKEELATKIGKTYHSTDIWIRNRRSKEQRAAAKQQTRVHAAAIVATTPLVNDTVMFDETNPAHPEEPVHAMAAPHPRRAKATKPGGRATKQATVQAAMKRPIRAKRQRTTVSYSPAIDNAATREHRTLNDHHECGDSNGSASHPPESTPPAIIHTWLPMAPEHALVLQRYLIEEQIAAQTMTEMKSMTKNPLTRPGRILSDAYEPWLFRLSSLPHVRMTRTESQKPEIGKWREERKVEIYQVEPYRVPPSWMAAPSWTGNVKRR